MNEPKAVKICNKKAESQLDKVMEKTLLEFRESQEKEHLNTDHLY